MSIKKPSKADNAVNGEHTRMSGPYVGKRVRIHGLQSRPELNGSVGLAASYDDARNRYNVQVQSNVGADPTRVISIALQPKNLEPAPDGGASGMGGMGGIPGMGGMPGMGAGMCTCAACV